MTLSDRLRRLLADRGCSISEAAKLADMEKQQVWRIVTGKVSNPGYLTVQRIVEAVGGSMAELAVDELTGQDRENNPEIRRLDS